MPMKRKTGTTTTKPAQSNAGGCRLIIPDSIVVDRREEDEAYLLSQSREWLTREERAPGIHASDLLDPRQAYWQRVSPKPIADRLVPTFLIGKVLHAIILHAVAGTNLTLTTDEGSRVSESLGIVYSPDLLRGAPIEIKTSRSFYEPKSLADLQLYCEQLLIYMAAVGSTTGHLWILYLNLKDEQGRTAPAFRAYDVTVSRAELEQYGKLCRQIGESITAAVEAKTPRALPLCREWKCSEKMCEWWHECQPEGRYEQTRRR